jgi:uncharacterized membrane protein YbhN (UPF0104 family)
MRDGSNPSVIAYHQHYSRSSVSAMKKRFGLLLKLAVSAGIVTVIARRTDLRAIAATFASIDPLTVAFAVVVAVVQTVVATYRWVLVMRAAGMEIRVWPALQAVYVCLCLGQCLPSYVGGDGYRIYWLYHEGQPLAPAVRVVVIDRISAFVALVVLLASGVPWLLMRFHDVPALTVMWTVLLCGVAGSVAFFSGDVLPQRWRRFRLVAEVAGLSATARQVLLTVGSGIPVMGLAVAVHTLTAVVTFAFAIDLGLPLGFLDCLFLMPLVTLISALPISISGWGVREGVMVAALSLLGVRPEQALVLSLLLGCMALFNGVLGVLPLTFGGGPRLGEMATQRLAEERE